MASVFDTAKSGMISAAKDLGNDAFRDVGSTYQRFLWQDTSRVLTGQHRTPEADKDAEEQQPQAPSPAPDKAGPDFDR